MLALSEAEEQTQIQPLAHNIKKLINYCQRILMKRGHAEFMKIPLYYLVLDRLEKLADEFRWLLDLTLSAKKHPAAIKELQILLRKAYELFYKHDPEEYTKYQYRTYNLRNEIKFGIHIDRVTIHLHNIARLLNSLYADIYAVRCI